MANLYKKYRTILNNLNKDIEKLESKERLTAKQSEKLKWLRKQASDIEHALNWS